MPESRLIYDQFKADILQWKNSHREEYNRFARLMTNGDERHYLAICRAIFKQLPKVKTEWELCWGDDSVENFDNISLLFSEESVPEQIVEAFQKQREENNSSDGTSSSFWNKVKSFLEASPKDMALSFPHRLYLAGCITERVSRQWSVWSTNNQPILKRTEWTGRVVLG